jgi:hypothetical protein
VGSTFELLTGLPVDGHFTDALVDHVLASVTGQAAIT